ncbi:CLUMA_CG019758, isoform A [Clunio marinus]|uniref:CLUMA_CG019758, isoform A n=1 Tax=Clunio marinus TaxID=568069 RepID=A0A1J1J4T7_9DIPT|nr:CLUMA_CG019758, isoform A [Clunio marinus]
MFDVYGFEKRSLANYLFIIPDSLNCLSTEAIFNRQLRERKMFPKTGENINSSSRQAQEFNIKTS